MGIQVVFRVSIFGLCAKFRYGRIPSGGRGVSREGGWREVDPEGDMSDGREKKSSMGGTLT